MFSMSIIVVQCIDFFIVFFLIVFFLFFFAHVPLLLCFRDMFWIDMFKDLL